MRAGLRFRKDTASGSEDGFKEFAVELTQPFSLQESAECGQAFRWFKEGEHYYCVLGQKVLRARQKGKKLYAALYPDTGYFSTLSAVGEVFRFDDDVREILAELSTDIHIRKGVALHRGLRLIRQDPWECLISYLCSINSNIPRIKSDVERLSKNYGTSIDVAGRVFHTFPTIDALANADEADIRKLRLGFRSKYIVSTARRVKDEKVDLMRFRRLGYEESFEALCSYDGVGPKVADCVLLFSMDKLEAFPVDRWVRRGVEILYFGGRKMTEKQVREWSREHFGRYAGYAQEYLFYGSRLKELVGTVTPRTSSA